MKGDPTLVYLNEHGYPDNLEPIGEGAFELRFTLPMRDHIGSADVDSTVTVCVNNEGRLEVRSREGFLWITPQGAANVVVLELGRRL